MSGSDIICIFLDTIWKVLGAFYRDARFRGNEMKIGEYLQHLDQRLLPDLAFIASKFEAMLKRASRGESPWDFLLDPDFLSPSGSLARPPASLWSQGLTMPGPWAGPVLLCRAAVLWDKMSSMQNDLTPRNTTVIRSKQCCVV